MENPQYGPSRPGGRRIAGDEEMSIALLHLLDQAGGEVVVPMERPASMRNCVPMSYPGPTPGTRRIAMVPVSALTRDEHVEVVAMQLRAQEEVRMSRPKRAKTPPSLQEIFELATSRRRAEEERLRVNPPSGKSYVEVVDEIMQYTKRPEFFVRDEDGREYVPPPSGPVTRKEPEPQVSAEPEPPRVHGGRNVGPVQKPRELR